MEKELNKYLPRDITKMILEIHYKSMFTEVINELEIIVSSLIKNLQLVDNNDLDYFSDETGNSYIGMITDELHSYGHYRVDNDDNDYWVKRVHRCANITDDDTDDDTDDNE